VIAITIRYQYKIYYIHKIEKGAKILNAQSIFLYLLSVYQLKTPAWNAAWMVTCYATDLGIHINPSKTLDATIHSEKITYFTAVLFGTWLCQF
jgi:hypothetical protein